jgi:hypothetical protein
MRYSLLYISIEIRHEVIKILFKFSYIELELIFQNFALTQITIKCKYQLINLKEGAKRFEGIVLHSCQGAHNCILYKFHTTESPDQHKEHIQH